MTDNNYRSVEERVIGAIAPLITAGAERAYNFGEYFAKAFYGTTVGTLRLPTSIRKLDNGQTWINRIPKEHRSEDGDVSGDRLAGFLLGGIAALVGIGCVVAEITYDIYGNFIPRGETEIAIAATNLASLFFEAGRKSRKISANNQTASA